MRLEQINYYLLAIIRLNSSVGVSKYDVSGRSGIIDMDFERNGASSSYLCEVKSLIDLLISSYLIEKLRYNV